MTLNSIALAFLLATNSWLGVKTVPAQNPEQWQIQSDWTESGGVYTLTATSEKIVQSCKDNPSGTIEFPSVIHGAHEVSLDGKSIMVYGDRTFKVTRSFYGSPTVPCSVVADGTRLDWTVHSYTKYFARISFFPVVAKGPSFSSFFEESLNLLTAGSLLVMAFFVFVVFRGKVGWPLVVSLALSNFGIGLYFLFSVIGLVGPQISMQVAHKIADVSVLAGIVLFFNAVRIYSLVPRSLFLVLAGSTAAAITIILMAKTGDSIQFGTTVPFTPGLVVCFVGLSRLVRRVHDLGFHMNSIFEFLSLGIFSAALINDIFVITGATHGQMYLPIGFISGLTFFALAVNEQIVKTYAERDFLQNNLEKEVIRKTSALERTMTELKAAQAELVQSAKLASLGSLSAGIAHEINNSLNYVYGGLLPLERIAKTSLPEGPREKALKLTGVMSEGLKLTFEIIKSLRNYTGLNQAKFADLSLGEVMNSVLTILKSRLGTRIETHVAVDPTLHLFGSVVGLNQVFMNLVTNAIDAMPDKGVLTIAALSDGESVTVKVTDTGTGIPEDIRGKIFDPFFTTKSVGSGTGLGLHIVKKEIDRHNGKIQVTSSVGEGTTFIIQLPISGTPDEIRSAA
jgi:signal transduction histidine kinase